MKYTEYSYDGVLVVDDNMMSIYVVCAILLVVGWYITRTPTNN